MGFLSHGKHSNDYNRSLQGGKQKLRFVRDLLYQKFVPHRLTSVKNIEEVINYRKESKQDFLRSKYLIIGGIILSLALITSFYLRYYYNPFETETSNALVSLDSAQFYTLYFQQNKKVGRDSIETSHYYSSSRLLAARYLVYQGSITGEAYSYYKSGNVFGQFRYFNGVLLSARFYYIDGSVISNLRPYDDDEIHVIRTTRHTSGQYIETTFSVYRDKLIEGTYEEKRRFIEVGR